MRLEQRSKGIIEVVAFTCAAAVLLMAVAYLQTNHVVARSWQWGKDGVVARYGEGYLEVRKGIPMLHLKGDPYQRGLQQGTLLKEQIRKWVPFFKEMFFADQNRDLVMQMTSSIESVLPEELKSECQGFADGSGQDYHEIMAANLAYDILRLGQCSQFMVLEEHTGAGLLHGRNWDFYGGSIAQSYLVLYVVEPEQGIPYAHVGTAGGLGAHTAINADGLVMAVNTLRGVPSYEQGTPLIVSFMDALTTCSTVEEAVQSLIIRPYLVGNIIGLSDSKTAAVMELGGEWRMSRRNHADGWLAVTNHASPRLGDACWRYSILHRRLAGLSQDEAFALEDSIDLLNDVAVDGTGPGGMLGASATLQSVVFEPEIMRLHLSIRGIPATRSREFISFTLDELFGR